MLLMEKWPLIWRVVAEILNKLPKRGGPPAWGLREMLTTPHRKNWPCYERIFTFASGLD
jgi:hypothetical protein